MHWKVQVVPEDESASESCLHCEINEVVREYIEGQENVDITDLAARMAKSLVELILLAPEEEHGKLPAATIAHLGHAFLGKTGEIEDGQDTTIDDEHLLTDKGRDALAQSGVQPGDSSAIDCRLLPPAHGLACGATRST